MFAVLLPVAWLIAVLFSPKAFWFPFWLAAVLWNGTDGQGGISHFWS